MTTLSEMESITISGRRPCTLHLFRRYMPFSRLPHRTEQAAAPGLLQNPYTLNMHVPATYIGSARAYKRQTKAIPTETRLLIEDVMCDNNLSLAEPPIVTVCEPYGIVWVRWCAAKPVATHGFTLTGLKAKAHLVNISVRCQNEIGWSDPSEVVPEVFTEGKRALGER